MASTFRIKRFARWNYEGLEGINLAALKFRRNIKAHEMKSHRFNSNRLFDKNDNKSIILRNKNHQRLLNNSRQEELEILKYSQHQPLLLIV